MFLVPPYTFGFEQNPRRKTSYRNCICCSHSLRPEALKNVLKTTACWWNVVSCSLLATFERSFYSCGDKWCQDVCNGSLEPRLFVTDGCSLGTLSADTLLGGPPAINSADSCGSGEQLQQQQFLQQPQQQQLKKNSPGRRKKPCLSSKEKNVRRIESNERERLRMHGLNVAFQVILLCYAMVMPGNSKIFVNCSTHVNTFCIPAAVGMCNNATSNVKIEKLNCYFVRAHSHGQYTIWYNSFRQIAIFPGHWLLHG